MVSKTETIILDDIEFKRIFGGDTVRYYVNGRYVAFWAIDTNTNRYEVIGAHDLHPVTLEKLDGE